MIDLTFSNIIRLFVLSFKHGDNDPTRNCFYKYYISLVEIKDFNALNYNKPFFDEPVKNKQEAYGKLVEMARNNDDTTWNLLDYFYYQNIIYLLVCNLSKQNNSATMFYIAEKQQKTISNYSLDLLNVTE